MEVAGYISPKALGVLTLSIALVLVVLDQQFRSAAIIAGFGILFFAFGFGMDLLEDRIS